MFLPFKKASLLIPTPQDGTPDLKHLFIVLTDPVNDEVLITPISSIKAGLYHDPSCVLEVGEHEFIKKRSSAFYMRSHIVSAQRLIDGVSKGHFIVKAAVTDAVYIRLCQGLLISDDTAFKNREYLRKFQESQK